MLGHCGVSYPQRPPGFPLSACSMFRWATCHVTHSGFNPGRAEAAILGYPIINVPSGNSFGLLLGISLIGTAFSEPTLIKLASGFEAVTRARQKPQFQPTLPLSNPTTASGLSPRSKRNIPSAGHRLVGKMCVKRATVDNDKTLATYLHPTKAC